MNNDSNIDTQLKDKILITLQDTQLERYYIVNKN